MGLITEEGLTETGLITETLEETGLITEKFLARIWLKIEEGLTVTGLLNKKELTETLQKSILTSCN